MVYIEGIMFVFLDIGFTLIGGPGIGPARRLADALKLSATDKSVLTEIIFRQSFANSAELADTIIGQFASHPDHTHAECQALWQAQTHEAYLLPGAAECISWLAASNIPFGFISNIWSPFYAGFKRLFPVESCTRPNFLSFELNLAKPDLALYQTALQQVGVAPTQAIMIGDTFQMDIAPPRQLGMKTVWILHRPQKELADIIKTLNGVWSPPDLTLANIGLLQVEHLHSLLEENIDV